MKSELILSTAAVVIMMGAASCDRQEQSTTPERTSSGPGVTKPLDAGTGNAEARSTQSGSGTRSDYKPTTGPGGIEETKEAPQPSR